MSKNITAILAQSRLLSAVDREEIDQLVVSSPLQKYAQGKTLFTKDDQADAAYVIISGEIAIEIMSPQGRTVRVATLREGSVFGEIAVLDMGTRTADARATEDTQVLRIGEKAFRDLITRAPEFALAIIKDLVEKLRMTDDQIEDISFKPLRSRVAALLIQLGDTIGGNTPTLQITQSALADRLSATREKVNIHLQALQAGNAIKLQRGRIDILDQDKLLDFIDEG